MWYIRSLKQKHSEENAANITEAKLEIKKRSSSSNFYWKIQRKYIYKKKITGLTSGISSASCGIL